jgi:hypothetical protein
MKHLLICVLMLASLASCAAPSGPGAFRCSERNKTCVKLTVAEPIKTGQPVSVTITVTSEKDIPELKVYLSTYPAGKVRIEEEPGQPSPKGDGVNWTTDVQANQPLTITRKINLPSVEAEYGGYALVQLIAFVETAPGVVVDDDLTIYVTRQDAKVYYANTPIPITPGLVLTVTPGPTPTFIPTSTTFFPSNP